MFQGDIPTLLQKNIPWSFKPKDMQVFGIGHSQKKEIQRGKKALNSLIFNKQLLYTIALLLRR